MFEERRMDEQVHSEKVAHCILDIIMAERSIIDFSY
jgi:hypothetical protein